MHVLSARVVSHCRAGSEQQPATVTITLAQGLLQLKQSQKQRKLWLYHGPGDDEVPPSFGRIIVPHADALTFPYPAWTRYVTSCLHVSASMKLRCRCRAPSLQELKSHRPTVDM